ncbi:(deoxy)nucleoside triphosphate pyrophosphohydrolase [Desulfoplanes sp.]
MGYVPVVAGVVVQEDVFLAAKRPQGGTFPGYWEFPGGKVERDEILDHALVRELDEELGIVPERYRLWQEKRKVYANNLHVWLYFFIVTRFRGDPRPREGQTIAWLTPEEAMSKKFLEADVDVLHTLSRLLGR